MDMDDPNAMVVSLLMGLIGTALFMYGKKQSRMPQLATGIILCVYPYFVTGAALMTTIGVGLLVLLAFAVKMGL